MTLEDTIALLNELIETSKNGELGYRTAGEHVRNSQLKTVFQEYARQRVRFIQQLHGEVIRLGGASTTAASLAAALHRGWIDVKSALSGGDGSTLVSACAAGEGAAIAAYEQALNMDLTGEIRAVVQQQLQQVREAHNHMLRLKESGVTAGNYPKTEMGRKES